MLAGEFRLYLVSSRAFKGLFQRVPSEPTFDAV